MQYSQALLGTLARRYSWIHVVSLDFEVLRIVPRRQGRAQAWHPQAARCRRACWATDRSWA